MNSKTLPQFRKLYERLPRDPKPGKQGISDMARKALLDWPLGDVVERWTSLLQNRAEREWLNAFRLRYLGLEASRPAWDAFRRQDE